MPKKNNDIKAFCPDLYCIILLKRLTDRQKALLFNKLSRLIKTSNSSTFDFIEYIRLIIEGCLTPESKKSFSNTIKGIQDIKEEKKSLDSLVEYKILIGYYQTIVSYYPEFRIEYVCYDVNEVLPDSVMLDSLLFDETEEEAPKPTAKPTAKTKKRAKSKEAFRMDSLDDLRDLELFLKRNIIGQDQAISKLCDSLKLKAAGFTDHTNMFFIGKTGRGKTQLAKKFGEKYSENYWIINCGEFTHGHEVGRLLGSPPGYVGHAETSMMMEKSNKSTRWTIVFDEVEKAHEKFYNFLLALLDTGKCTDNSGNEIDFTDSIFILTSNCGLKDLKKETLSFVQTPSVDGDKDQIMKALERHFPPEFRGRIDEFIFFNDLNDKDIEEIVKLNLKKYPIKATPQVVAHIQKHGYTEEFGAREVERSIKSFIALPLADELLSSRKPNDGSGKFDLDIVEGKVEVINTVSV
tara:strand:+ start:2389 stop:3777 length:1389 start_codon:yes stop_codon:yes gene_type:complete